MPVLLTLCGAVLFLLTLVLVFIEFGEKSGCCGQYTFLFFFNLFLIIPVVVWTAMVVFPMGIPTNNGELVININVKRQQEYANRILFQTHNYGN